MRGSEGIEEIEGRGEMTSGEEGGGEGSGGLERGEGGGEGEEGRGG